MTRKAKKAGTTWEAVRRAAVDEAARLVLLDPEADDALVEQAAQHLSTQDSLTQAQRRVPGMNLETLRLIKVAMGGVVQPPTRPQPAPIVQATELVATVAPQAATPGDPAIPQAAMPAKAEAPERTTHNVSRIIPSDPMPDPPEHAGYKVGKGSRYPRW